MSITPFRFGFNHIPFRMSKPAAKPKIIAVIGPTASGKTALAIRLAKELHGEIISADSRQIYRGMNIGTAKPVRDSGHKYFFSEGVRHHLLDIRNPDDPYTVAEFQRDASAAIRDILRRKKLPVLAGGTGLYVQAVTENLELPDVPPDEILRKKLNARMAREGLDALFSELVRLDPEAEYVVDSRNPRRVIRALEVALSTGRPFTSQRQKRPVPFSVLKLGLQPPKEVLFRRIAGRTRKMIADDLFRETEKLLKKYDFVPALEAIGYRETAACLRGEISPAQAEGLMNKNTRAYAKRQITWFKRDAEIKWVRNAGQALRLARAFLKSE